MNSKNGKGAIGHNNDAQREMTGNPSVPGNGNGRQEAIDILSETVRVYGIVDNQVISYVWNDPELRESLRRKFVFSECNKVRVKIRNEKLDSLQRYESAQHASQVRWQRVRENREVLWKRLMCPRSL